MEEEIENFLSINTCRMEMMIEEEKELFSWDCMSYYL
jgi:hypothetical protein